MITTIIFDIGNTLLKFIPNVPIEHSVTPIVASIKLLKKLSKKYQIFAVTDASLEQIDYELYNFEFFMYFEDLIISEKCDLKKCDPKIYHYIIKKHNLNAIECVFIDDREENINAAKIAGVNVILFTTPEDCESKLENLGVTFFNI